MNSDMHILVADDNAALASVLRFNLERAGFRVTVALNGSIAWDFFQHDTFDFVITDQQMPIMTGSDLCHCIRNEAHSRVPILMLTAKGMEMELNHLRETLDVTATFIKPFSPREIVAAVEEILTTSG